jgi:DNA modification methylase
MISEVYNEDILTGMAKIPNESVDCIITSPPYWQLRDYKWDGQWGLEPTFGLYLEHLWQFMEESMRVLKTEGTVWINLGDTYSKTGMSGGNPEKFPEALKINRPKSLIPDKCLLLIPHRFAIGCIDRGWIIRNDIIWAKRNGMPESVTDRFSKKHEYFFLIVKSDDYYFDLDGIRDNHSQSTVQRYKTGWKGFEDRDYTNGPQSHYGKFSNNPEAKKEALEKGKNPGSVSDFWDIPTMPSNDDHYATYNTRLIDKPIVAGCPIGGTILDPFMGTGTTGIRALELGRNFIGIEGSEKHFNDAKKKIELFKSQQKLQFT